MKSPLHHIGPAAVLAAMLAGCAAVPEAEEKVAPPMAQAGPYATLPAIGQVNERFQSYNVEMVEVTGGRFWAPYGGPEDEVYRMRPPIALDDPKLRALTRQLSPAYMRISGTWANKTYLPLEGEHISEAPDGYDGILTRDQWREVIAFSKAVDAPIMLSFAVGPGARDEDGIWITDQAQRLADLTKEEGGTIAAVEFFNEPNAAFLSSLPKNYGATDYIRDFRIFHDWVRKALPEAKIFGIGNVNEGSNGDEVPVAMKGTSIIFSKDVMPNISGMLDGVSYHFYGTISQRCAGRSRLKPAKQEDALTPAWLDGSLVDLAYIRQLRDAYEPGDPIWITETAQAACGGSPWASSFLDSFRYVNQMALHAQNGVDVIFHNTLAASDYALLDDENFAPRPNYWAALLWDRSMGQTVLASPESPSRDVKLYAQCQKGKPGGVTVAAINLGKEQHRLITGPGAQIWTMTAAETTAKTVSINGHLPELLADETLAGLEGKDAVGSVQIPGTSISFITLPGAGNKACN